MADTIEEIAYDISVRKIDQQHDSLEALRTRAGTLLAAGALVGSFFGAQVLKQSDGHVGFWLALGIVALMIEIVSVLVIQWPWPFTFRESATVVLEDHERGKYPGGPKAVYSFLAKHHDHNHACNERTMERLRVVFRVAAVAIVVEAVALTVAL